MNPSTILNIKNEITYSAPLWKKNNASISLFMASVINDLDVKQKKEKEEKNKRLL